MEQKYAIDSLPQQDRIEFILRLSRLERDKPSLSEIYSYMNQVIMFNMIYCAVLLILAFSNPFLLTHYIERFTNVLVTADTIWACGLIVLALIHAVQCKRWNGYHSELLDKFFNFTITPRRRTR